MAVREIVVHPHPILRKKAREVQDFGQELQQLIEDMFDTLRWASGVGLAAPQVNVPLRVLVVEYAHEEGIPPERYALVNPKLVYVSPETEIGTEGCLSIPGVFGEVVRARSIIVTGQDRFGNPITIRAHGWLARIFQHEIDHLNGILFIDKALRTWKETPEPTEMVLQARK